MTLSEADLAAAAAKVKEAASKASAVPVIGVTALSSKLPFVCYLKQIGFFERRILNADDLLQVLTLIGTPPREWGDAWHGGPVPPDANESGLIYGEREARLVIFAEVARPPSMLDSTDSSNVDRQRATLSISKSYKLKWQLEQRENKE